MLKSGIHDLKTNFESKQIVDSWFKSEKDAVLEVSKLTKIIVYFQDANVTKKKILILSMVTFLSNQKVCVLKHMQMVIQALHYLTVLYSI